MGGRRGTLASAAHPRGRLHAALRRHAVELHAGARPFPLQTPSPYLVPGIAKHILDRVETGGLFRTRITACYYYRVETGPYFVPGLPHATRMLIEMRLALYFVPGLPHAILIELRLALISYQDYDMLLLTFAGPGTTAASRHRPVSDGPAVPQPDAHAHQRCTC